MFEAQSPSRRTLLTAAAGAVAAMIAQAIGRPLAAEAVDQSVTFTDDQNNNTVLTARSASNGSGTGGGTGIHGDSGSATGVYGSSSTWYGVYGFSAWNAGVFGSSGQGNGVLGQSQNADGIHGSALLNGVSGQSFGAGASGVYGWNDDQGFGVAGRSNAPAHSGVVTDTAALLGENTVDGVGVWARSQHGVGLLADAVYSDAIAFKAQGVTQFRRSGRLTIKAGKDFATKTGIRIDAGSLVLATLQQDRPGTYVRSAVPNSAAGSFTIRLNTTVGADTRVGWFIVN